MPPSRIYKGTTLVYERPTASPLTAFLPGLATGTRIQLFRAANVRTDAVIATNTLTGVNLSGTRGTIRGGPKTGVSNSIWYDINFDTGHDGWVVSDNYTVITSTTTETTPATFRVGDTIRLFRRSNVRSSAAIATNLLRVANTNETGTITQGPTRTGTINWYRIDFATGTDGWVASDNFVKVSTGGGGGGDDWVTGSCAPAVPSNGKIINVAAGGSIQNAVNSAKPGDTIVVANGTYNGKLFLSKANSGTASGWITIKSAQPHGAKINVRAQLVAADYIRIEGFEFTGTGAGGLSITSVHHLQLLNNHVNRGSINIGMSDFLLIEGNVVHDSTHIWNQMAVLWPQNITGDMTTKNRIIIRNNVSYDNRWTGETDASGLMLDSFTRDPSSLKPGGYVPTHSRVTPKQYPFGAIIDNNILYGNNGAGLYLNYSSYLTISNNIVHNNNVRSDGGSWAGGILNVNSGHNVFKDNVAVTPGTKQTYGISVKNFPSSPPGTNNSWIGNITYNVNKPGDLSINVPAEYPIPTATNKLGQGSKYATRPTTFLKKTCS